MRRKKERKEMGKQRAIKKLNEKRENKIKC
jgi:hypothetical protein